MTKREEIIKTAIKEVGTTESPAGSNRVKYNDWLYGRTVSGPSFPWCAAFVSWVFAQVEPGLVKKTASCQEMGDWFKSKGLFHRVNPEPGDVVFFKYSTNSRWTNHVGIVESVRPDGSITTIEGNTSFEEKGSQDNGGAVAARIRKKNIVGYGRPNYAGWKPTLKQGSKGPAVKELQELLNKKGFYVDIDSDFGPMTKQAVISYQGSMNLYKDGIVGAKTWEKLTT